MTVEFVDQLPGLSVGRRKARFEENVAFAAELRGNRGVWAIYPWANEWKDGTRMSRASDINTGQDTAPAGLQVGFEAAVRTNDAGETHLYVRYVGRKARR